MRLTVFFAIASLLCLNAGCAWANRDNRPVWNAFEAKLVPDATLPFVLTLPLTIPAGLVSIVTDTFIVHPATVIDDAWDDATELWNDLDWNEHYYTELASLPFRTVGTPIVFVFVFLGRSMFDLPRDLTPEEFAAREATAEARRVADLVKWLNRLAEGGHESFYGPGPKTWSADLAAAFDRARSSADALGRAAVYRVARRLSLPPWVEQPWLGLLDADPIVRYQELDELEAGIDPPATVIDALRDDPSESIRIVARSRWPR